MATHPKSLDPQPARLGEIVEASTTRLRAVAPRTFSAPSFGSFVKTSDGSRTTYGVVAHVEHASVDPSRKAIPLGRSWDELEREQPQVLDLLTTEFDAMCVAFADDSGGIRPYLPPVPPRVHDFVTACEPPEIIELTEDLSFIRTLAATGLPVAAELVAASIRDAASHRTDLRAFLIRAGREVADLYRQDYEQASAIIRRFGLDAAAAPKKRAKSR
ncbi:MAG TPA: hypothetical protein VFA34_08165 [Actinomycetota bacterium]|jgi:hypothetical protein|nr:hypothetical protein [Actinomycetota bacterium]